MKRLPKGFENLPRPITKKVLLLEYNGTKNDEKVSCPSKKCKDCLFDLPEGACLFSRPEDGVDILLKYNLITKAEALDILLGGERNDCTYTKNI